MYARLEAVVPLFGRVIAEVLLRLVPCRHGLALDDQVGLLVIGRAVFGVGHMQAEGGGFVAITTAVLAHILPNRRVVELHDGEARVLLHKLPSVTARRHIDGHRRTVVAKVVADATPTDSHGVALCGVAAAKDEVFGEEGEAVLGEILLHIKGRKFVVVFHLFFVLFLWCRALAQKAEHQSRQ